MRINLDGGYIDANVTIKHSSNAQLYVRNFSSQADPYLRRFSDAYKVNDSKIAFGFGVKDLNSPRGDRNASMQFSNITAHSSLTQDGSITQLQNWDMAFGDAEVMSDQGDNIYEQTVISCDKPLKLVGTIGDISHAYRISNTGYGTSKVTLAGGGGVNVDVNGRGNAVVGASMPTSFKVDFSQHNYTNGESYIAVGIHLPYTKLYPLTYDPNGGVGDVPRQ